VAATCSERATCSATGTTSGGLSACAILEPSSRTVLAFTRHDALGIAHDGIDDQGFAVALNLRDPDGIALEFYVVLRPAAT